MAGVAGEVDLTFDSVFLMDPQVKAGKLKYIAVASEETAEVATRGACHR